MNEVVQPLAAERVVESEPLELDVGVRLEGGLEVEIGGGGGRQGLRFHVPFLETSGYPYGCGQTFIVSGWVPRSKQFRPFFRLQCVPV
ncbi:MAG: hypothetical protein FJ284_04535 [Planctomycetes bacterium]|nr:hypothetical protein [Planctomycetota bacterium]